MVKLLEAVVELLKAQEARQIALIAQVDQIEAALRELEAWANMCEELRTK